MAGAAERRHGGTKAKSEPHLATAATLDLLGLPTITHRRGGFTCEGGTGQASWGAHILSPRTPLPSNSFPVPLLWGVLIPNTSDSLSPRWLLKLTPQSIRVSFGIPYPSHPTGSFRFNTPVVSSQTDRALPPLRRDSTLTCRRHYRQKDAGRRRTPRRRRSKPAAAEGNRPFLVRAAWRSFAEARHWLRWSDEWRKKHRSRQGRAGEFDTRLHPCCRLLPGFRCSVAGLARSPGPHPPRLTPLQGRACKAQPHGWQLSQARTRRPQPIRCFVSPDVPATDGRDSIRTLDQSVTLFCLQVLHVHLLWVSFLSTLVPFPICIVVFRFYPIVSIESPIGTLLVPHRHPPQNDRSSSLVQTRHCP